MSRSTLALLLLPLSILLIGCPARPQPLDQPHIILAEGAYVHEKSGMTFPIAVGDFQRGAVQRYDREGLDVSAGYNLFDSRRQIIATVYVYPAPSLLSIGSPPQTVDSAR